MRHGSKLLAFAIVVASVAPFVASSPAIAQTDGTTGGIPATWSSFDATVKMPGALHAGAIIPADAAGLIRAGGGLGDVDLLTGSLYGADVRAVGDPGQLAVADMFAADQLAIDAQRMAEQARLEAERRRLAEEAKRRLASVRELDGVPAVVVDAANRASSSARCSVPVAVLIGFLKAEAGSYLGRLDATGLPSSPIRANEPMAGGDTDDGRVDGDASQDWAVGPAQFAPPAWSQFGRDGSGDGAADPQNIYDATASMAEMLCWLADRRGVSLDDDNGVFLVAGDYTNGWGANWQANSRQAGYATKKLELVRGVTAELAGGATSAQTQIGPDGCPTSAPPNTLRDGSASIGVHELCVRSVAQAPTPQAAQALKFTFANLGVPYSQPRRNNAGYFDCSSYVTRAFQSAGVPIAPPGQNAPTTHTLLPHSWGARPAWSVPIEASSARPGDLVFPHQGHVTMLIADGFVIHTAATGDVSNIRAMYTDPLAFRRIDPSKV